MDSVPGVRVWGGGIAASTLVGDKQRGVEFVMRARHLLEYLFDSSNMEVAEGLMCMAYYSYSQVRHEKRGQRQHVASLYIFYYNDSHLDLLELRKKKLTIVAILIGSANTILILRHLGKEHPKATQCIWIRYIDSCVTSIFTASNLST